MKKLIATFCLAIGIAFASDTTVHAANTALNSPAVSSVQEKSDKPDTIIIVTDNNGVIIEIIVIKNM